MPQHWAALGMSNPSRRKRTPRSGEAKQKNLFRTKRRSDQDRRPERRTRARDLSAVDDAQPRLKLFLRPQRKLRRLSSCPRYFQQPSLGVVGREKRMLIRRLLAQKKVESGGQGARSHPIYACVAHEPNSFRIRTCTKMGEGWLHIVTLVLGLEFGTWLQVRDSAVQPAWGSDRWKEA